MKVIDLFNQGANGEKMPEEIKYNGEIYFLDDGNYSTYNKYGYLERFFQWEWSLFEHLNDEVEIIEEQKEETKTTTRESIEVLGYACGEIQKCFINGWEKSLKNKSLNEEDKKIEHLDIYNCFKVMGIDKTGRLDENFTDISNKINELIDKINKEDK